MRGIVFFSEKSWILERKKTPKPKPKTYKSRTRDGSCYNSQTESSDDENEEDNKSTVRQTLKMFCCSPTQKCLIGLEGRKGCAFFLPVKGPISKQNYCTNK